MKLLFLTDVHDRRAALGWVTRKGKGYDAIIVGGDLARVGTQGFAQEFLSAALSTGSRVFYVPGNIDSPTAPVPAGVLQLHGKTSKVGGYSIGGLGGSNATPFRTVFELPDEEARGVLSGLGRVEILVSHCPPVNTKCDRAGASHIGSMPVREYVVRERPSLVLSGHAHESRAVDKLGDTTLVNAGPLMQGNYAEVSLDGLISVELKNEGLGEEQIPSA